MPDGDPAARRLEAWQRALLPFMMWMIILLAAFFFVASIVQLYGLEKRIGAAPSLDLGPLFDDRQVSAVQTGGPGAVEMARWRILTALERGAVERRYHQANVLLMSRVWIQYLGFVTGMILALVGAVFILGRLSETASQLKGSGAGWTVELSTASPGLALAVLGTALMLITLLIRHEIRVNDAQVYTATMAPAATLDQYPGAAGRPPAAWPAGPEIPSATKAGPAQPSDADGELELLKKRALEKQKGKDAGDKNR